MTVPDLAPQGLQGLQDPTRSTGTGCVRRPRLPLFSLLVDARFGSDKLRCFDCTRPGAAHADLGLHMSYTMLACKASREDGVRLWCWCKASLEILRSAISPHRSKTDSWPRTCSNTPVT